MLLLLASILVLLVAPVLYQLLRARQILVSALDGFLFTAIGGLVMIDVVPELVERSGWWIVPFVLLGFLGPTAIEKSFRSFARSTHGVAILLGLVSLGLHAFADGAALIPGTDSSNVHSLPIAVILHRIPVGLTIWWLVRPTFGKIAALSVLGLVAASTAIGFYSGGMLAGVLAGSPMSLFKALVAGSLMHVIVHRTELQRDSAGTATLAQRRVFGSIGALMAAFFLALDIGIYSHHSPLTASVWETFWSLSLESAPALLIAYVLAGFISGFIPQASIHWMNRGNTLSQALRGMVVGLPLPVCSCGVVPLFRSLTQKGAGAAAALAFLMATPELSLDAAILSFPLLGTEMAIVRLVAAALVALMVGWIVGTFYKRLGTKVGSPVAEIIACDAPVTMSLKSRLRTAAHFSLEVVDHTAPWLLLGLGIAAVLEPQMTGGLLDQIPDGLEVPIFALLGMPTYVCASGATPLVAVLLAKGVSPGAALAFLLTGPATNVTTFGVISSVLGKRTAAAFGCITVGLSVATGYLVNWIDPKVGELPLKTGLETTGLLTLTCLVAVAALFVLSLFRQGPRGFLGQIIFS